MLSLLLPRICPFCGRTMLPQEEGVCLRCLARLPRVHAEMPGNEVERRLFGRFPFQHATSFCYYEHNGTFSRLIRQAKFYEQPWLNAQFTRLFVQELQAAAALSGEPGWPYDVDVILPIPIHTLRLLHRGYNQASPIAEVLAEAWHIPLLADCLYKSRYTSSQVRLSLSERLDNETGSFALRRPERLAHRHVLLVDDVITTAATITAVADTLLAVVPGVRISVLSLSFAKS